MRKKFFTSLLVSTFVATVALPAMADDGAESDWKYVGQSRVVEDIYKTFSDDATGHHSYFVDTEESITTPGLYRLKDPFKYAPSVLGFTHGTPTADRYLIIHAEDPDKVYFESFDTGLLSDSYGGKVELVSQAGRRIAAGTMTLDAAAAAGYTGKLASGPYGIHRDWIKFEATAEDGNPLVYAVTPKGRVDINVAGSTLLDNTVNADALSSAGFAIQLPDPKRWVDVIDGETLSFVARNDTYTEVPDIKAENNSRITSPAAYNFQNRFYNGQTVKLDANGVITIGQLADLVSVREGGCPSRVSIYFNEETKSRSFRLTATDSSKMWYVTGTGDNYPANCIISDLVLGYTDTNIQLYNTQSSEAKIDRIEIEWYFDENPWYTPKCNMSDGQDVNVTNQLLINKGHNYTTFGDCNELWYQINDGEETKYDAVNPPTLPWGRTKVKMFSRRHRRQDSEPLIINVNVFSAPRLISDVLDISKYPAQTYPAKVYTTEPGDPGIKSGAQYMLRYYKDESDTYGTFNNRNAALMTVKSGGRLAKATIYYDSDAVAAYSPNYNYYWYRFENATEPITEWPGDYKWPYGKVKSISGAKQIDISQIRTEAVDPGYSVFEFGPATVDYPVIKLNYVSLFVKKIVLDWENKDAFCERPMLSIESGEKFYEGAALKFDCLSSGVTYNVKVNGADVTYNPESGLVLPAGTEVKVEVFTSRDGSDNSETVTAVYNVVPRKVDDLAAHKNLAETSMPVEIASDLSVIYRNGNEIYLSDATGNSVRAIGSETASVAAFDAGQILKGVRAVAIENSDDIMLTEVAAEGTQGKAPVYNTVAVADLDATDKGFKPVRLERVSIVPKMRAPNLYTIWQGNDHADLINRYAEGEGVTTVVINSRDTKFYNVEGLASQGYVIATAATEICAEPVFAFSADVDDLHGRDELTLTCADEDATIYVSINDAEEVVYTSPIVLAPGTYSVVSRATCHGMDNSQSVKIGFNVAHARVATLTALVASGEKEMPVEVEGTASVIYRNNRELYMKEEDGAFRATLSDDFEGADAIVAGSQLRGIMACNDINAGDIILLAMPQVADGETPLVQTVTIAECAQKNLYTPIRIESVSLNETDVENSYDMAVGDEKATLINRFVDADRFDKTIEIELSDGRRFNVEGLTEKVGVIATSVRGICATPVITPVHGSTFEQGGVIMIDCADAGATIYYSINGSEEAVYIEPVAPALGMVTVKARAVCDGMDDSEIAEATYEVEAGLATIISAIENGEAEVFDVAGRRMTGSSLAPGLYVVRMTDSTVAKRVTIK